VALTETLGRVSFVFCVNDTPGTTIDTPLFFPQDEILLSKDKTIA
jgi:hypothetical protein